MGLLDLFRSKREPCPDCSSPTLLGRSNSKPKGKLVNTWALTSAQEVALQVAKAKAARPHNLAKAALAGERLREPLHLPIEVRRFQGQAPHVVSL